MTAFSVTAVLCSGCSDLIYGVDVVNYGRSGVLILQVGEEKAASPHSYFSKVGVPFPVIAGREPSMPTKYRDPADSFGYFGGHPNSLPKEVEVVWQLAELSECRKDILITSEKSKTEVKSLGYDPANHVVKGSCTWRPMPDKIFRKKLDMRALRKTDEYKRAGDFTWDVLFARYRLNLTLVFIEDQVTIKAENYSSNPWK